MNNYSKKIFYALTAVMCLFYFSFFVAADKPILIFTYVNIVNSVIFIVLALLLYKLNFRPTEIFFFMIVFLAVRFFFINTSPIGSDDIYRYIWDGKLQFNGINPYEYTPNNKSLLSLHSEILPAKVNFPNLKSIYFPLSQWIFYLGYIISGESVWGYKLLIILAELFTIAALIKLLHHFKLEKKYLLLYILSPLPVIHFALDAHVDVFGFPLILFALYYFLSDKKVFGSILLGLSLSIKPVGLVLIPIFFLNSKTTKDKITVLFLPATIFFSQFIPYILTSNPFEAFIIYTKNWTFNGIVFELLNLIFRNNQSTRMLCGILLTLILLPVYFSNKDITQKIFFSVILMMIFSPVVHPWYLGWVAILIPFAKNKSGVILTALSSLTSFTILNYILNGVWTQYWFVLILEYIPAIIFLLLEYISEKKNKKSGLAPAS